MVHLVEWGSIEEPGLTAGPCMCVAEHRPPVVTFQRHHVVPKSWGGPDVATWNGRRQIVVVCGTTHDSVHKLLNHYVRCKGTPPTTTTKLFTRYTQVLAAEAWANKPPNHPTPYTLSVGTHPNQQQEEP